MLSLRLTGSTSNVTRRCRKGLRLGRVDRETRVCNMFRGKKTSGHNTKLNCEADCICSLYNPQYSPDKSIGLDMTTTPSSGNVAVLGLLTDPAFSCMKSFPSSQTVHKVVQSLWGAIGERVDEDFTSETTKPSATVVLSGEIDPFTHFKVLTCFHQSRA
jgi:hypothetical protein